MPALKNKNPNLKIILFLRWNIYAPLYLFSKNGRYCECPALQTGHPDEENTPLNSKVVHKALFGNLPDCDVCVIDAIFI